MEYVKKQEIWENYRRIGIVLNLEGILNIAAVSALIIGLVMIVATQALGNSSILVLLQPSAFFIVIGGTFCASLLNFNYATIKKAFKTAKEVFYKEENKTIKVIDDIIQLSYFARKNGLLALQNVLSQVQDPFLARGLQLAIDINNPQLIYDVLSAEITYEEEEELINSRVFEALGGYAPTFGVVGAVMGLIQVMSNIKDIHYLGTGIATAFVSTLYGVGFANLILLPIAGNLKQKTRERILLKEVILQGIVSILMQENPAIIEEKLVSYLKFHHKNYDRV